jgi:alpha/beta superfamily hydrolase
MGAHDRQSSAIGGQVEPSLARRTMLPCFFGMPARQLFGLYEAPPAHTRTDRGVALCYPYGRDYVAAHRAFRVLAGRLAGVGFHALRFDYCGTGDSWGEADNASIRQRIDDILTAVDWLRASYGAVDVSLVGLRLGASLATLAAAECGRVERLVLWEPVIDGRVEVADMVARHHAWLDAQVRVRPGARALACEDELLGYRFTATMRRDLEEVSLWSLRQSPAPNVQIISAQPNLEHDRLARHLEGLGSRVETVCVAGPKVWGTNPGTEQPVVPAEAVQAIVRGLQVVRP